MTYSSTSNDLLPMRLHNAVTSETAPLRYPPGVPVGHPLPQQRYELYTLTGMFSLLMNLNFINISRLSGAQCQDISAHLGLPPMSANTTVLERRRQIGDYLGVSLYA